MKKLKNNLKVFLEINSETAASPKILWETTKCFIRGEALSFATHLKATRRRKITELEGEIRTLESDLKQQFSEQNHSALSALKFELNNLLKVKAEFTIHRTRLTYYDQSERSSKLLAARLKQNESFSTISAIQTSSGQVTYDPGEINNTFAEFYSHLYMADPAPDLPALKLYLSELKLPSLTDNDAESLETPLTLLELKEALSSMQKGKSPGLDGLPPELFLELWDVIGPLLLNSLSNYALDTGSFHRDQNTSLISVLLIS